MTDANSILFHVLDVGQGMGHFIEMFDSSGKIVATALIDLGSTSSESKVKVPVVNFVVERLNKMASDNSNKATINFLALSHSDNDHINMVGDVVKKFAKPKHLESGKNELEVLRVVYGGNWTNYGSDKKPNILEALKGYLGDKGVILSLTPSHSTYSKGGIENPLDTVMGVKFHLLVGNAVEVGGEKGPPKKNPVPEGSDKNLVSLILVTEYMDCKFVTTGDAKGDTLVAANKIISDTDPSFDNTQLLTVPHHGARPTLFDVKSDKDRVEPEQNARKFAGYIKPKSIHASAEPHKGYKHPSAYVMSLFWEHVAKSIEYSDPTLDSKNAHYYQAYFLPKEGFEFNDPVADKNRELKQGRYQSLATRWAILTNRYFDRNLIFEPQVEPKRTKRPRYEAPALIGTYEAPIAGSRKRRRDSSLKLALFPDTSSNTGNIIELPEKAEEEPPPLTVTWIYRTEASGTEIYPKRDDESVEEALASEPAFRFSNSPNVQGRGNGDSSSVDNRDEPSESGRWQTARPPAVGPARQFPRLRVLS